MSTAIQVQIAQRAAEIGPTDWEPFAAPYASARWYRFCETAAAGDTPFYITASRQGEPLAFAACWLTHQEPLPISNRLARRGMQAVLRRWPLLICRSPFVNQAGLILLDSPFRNEALAAIAQAARQIGQERRAFAVLFDYLGSRLKTSPPGPLSANGEGGSSGQPVPSTERGLRGEVWPLTADLTWPEGFMTMEMTEPGTHLPLTWPDFEHYVQSLGKSARKDYHRHSNRAADLGITVRALPRVTDIDGALRLIRSVEAHHHTAPNPYARGMLENAEAIGAAWLAAEINGQLVGCGLLLPDGGALTLALLGLDYTAQYAYFQLMYAAIRHAIQAGASVLRGGTGAYEFKQRLGFQTEPRSSIAFYITNGVLRRVAGWV